MKPGILLLLMATPLYAAAAEPSVEHYCTPNDVEYGDCKKGDLTVVLSADDAVMVCDFDKDVIPFSSGDHFICYYRGSARVRRVRPPSNE